MYKNPTISHSPLAIINPKILKSKTTTKKYK